MAQKRIHNPDKSFSADVSRVSRSHDQDGHLTPGKNFRDEQLKLSRRGICLLDVEIFNPLSVFTMFMFYLLASRLRQEFTSHFL